MADDDTLRFYADNATTYAQHRTSASGGALDRFLAALPAGGRVLELGCGNGMDAERMLALGFDVDATDGTPGLVVEAQKRIGQRARVMRFEDLDAESDYDGVWASASLLHVPAAGLPQVLGSIRRALRPGGTFVASFKAGSGEGRDRLGRYYNYPSAARLGADYRAGGWSDLTLETTMGSGFDALPTEWLWMTARR
ncbi:class I SAM-dependent methyltransferase [Devosia sediminis]|uniref:Class I SAM-dependent methyltransferase n=1 Tax=Devosia sediminis TaxID=2798801 RepID=A0A934IT48_9HYPH|nr:class I SAM-dependent methyltransferase [Devosia sediminis]MBJ3786293.1 class I SAM-dependent methyltransferase [Devosia sediminis]